MAGALIPYCACRNEETGKPYGSRKRKNPDSGREEFWSDCPQWASRSHRKWMFVIDLPRGGGKRRQLKRMGFITRSAAEAALLKESHSIVVGEAPTLAARQTTLKEFITGWMAGQPDWRPSTRRTYKSLADHYVIPALGHAKVTEIRAQHVRELLAQARAGRLGRNVLSKEPGTPPGQKTIAMVHGFLGAVMRAAVDERLITFNPVSAVKPGKTEPSEAAAWTTTERDAFLALVAEKKPRLHAPLALAAHRGLRRGELCALRWSEVDLEARTAVVSRNAVEVGHGETVIGKPKSKNFPKRTVGIGPQVTALLKAHRRRQLNDRMAAGPAWADEDLVLCDSRGQMIRPWLLSKEFSALAREAGLPGSLHTLRHTSASVMLRSGQPAQVAADQLGHDVGMLLKVYAHVIKEQRIDSADLAEAWADGK